MSGNEVSINMKKCDVAKKLRKILYEKDSSNDLIDEFKTILDLCGCEDYDIIIIEKKDAIIIEIPHCIQYIKNLSLNRIYEVIPEDSPIKKYLGKSYYDKKERKYVEKEPSKEWRKYIHQRIISSLDM
jgi:hypothetical protein